MITRPAIFKWRQTEAGLILCALRWYLRFSLSLRDVEELLEERGLQVDHTTVWRRSSNSPTAKAATQNARKQVPTMADALVIPPE